MADINLDEDERKGKAVIAVPKTTEEALAQAMALAKEMHCLNKVRAALSTPVTKVINEVLTALKAKASAQGNGRSQIIGGSQV